MKGSIVQYNTYIPVNLGSKCCSTQLLKAVFMWNSNNATVTISSSIRAPIIFILFEEYQLSISTQHSSCWLYQWDLYIFSSDPLSSTVTIVLPTVTYWSILDRCCCLWVLFAGVLRFFIYYLQSFNIYQIALLLTPNLSTRSYWYESGLDSRSCLNCTISIFKHGLFLCTFGYRLLI